MYIGCSCYCTVYVCVHVFYFLTFAIHISLWKEGKVFTVTLGETIRVGWGVGVVCMRVGESVWVIRWGDERGWDGVEVIIP